MEGRIESQAHLVVEFTQKWKNIWGDPLKRNFLHDNRNTVHVCRYATETKWLFLAVILQ